MTTIVDMSHMFYRNIFAAKDAVIKDPNLCAHLLLNSLYHVVDKFEISEKNLLVAAFDCRRKDNWRTKFYAEYKPKNYLNLTYKGQRILDPTIPWNKIWEIMNDVKQLLREGSDVIVLEHSEAEADDIIYVVSRTDCTIISSDKDFYQLISEGGAHSPIVKQYDPIKQKFIEIDSPETFLIEHILKGDKADNILPVKRGMGEKTAVKYAKQIDAYLKAEPEIFEKYFFNKILIDLREVPDYIREDIENNFFNHKQFNYNMMKVINFCRKYKLRKLAERIDQLHYVKTNLDEWL